MGTGSVSTIYYFFFFQAEDGIRDVAVTGVQTCALPISSTATAISMMRSPRRGLVPVASTSTTAKRQASSPGLAAAAASVQRPSGSRSEEHTSELQSRLHLVCRLLLEKKKKSQETATTTEL